MRTCAGYSTPRAWPTPRLLASPRAPVLGLGRAARLLMETVRRNRTVTDRIAADIDAMIGGFAAYAGPQLAPDTIPWPGGGGAARRAAVRSDDGRRRRRPARRGNSARTSRPRRSRRPRRPGRRGRTPPRTAVKREVVDPSASVPREPARQLTERVRARRWRVGGGAGRGQRPRGAGGPADRLAGGAAAAPPRRDARAARRGLGGPPGGRGGGPGAAVRGGQRDHRVRRLGGRRAPRRPGRPACARRPGATRAWCRRRSRARCGPWPPRGRSRPPAWWRLVTALAVAAGRARRRRRRRCRW